MYPDVPAVFVDTGLEYPEIREFVRTVENVEWLKPKMNFRQVIEKYGYPVVSKKTAANIRKLKTCNLTERYRNYILNGDERGTKGKLAECWKKLINAPFKVSEYCCMVMKKRPFHIYNKQTSRKPFIGTMASDGMDREMNYIKQGCNSFSNKNPNSTPLGFWLESDIWGYIRKNSIPYSKIYDMGAERTGCMFCMFGCHLEKQPNRFQRMKFTHPQLYHYCMKPWSEGGLGLAEVLDYIHVPYGDYIPCLKDYKQMEMAVSVKEAYQ
jgi:3'-phosphoadenosine 5'-phosphosulfate sulfotransferase (PAPS reductase)/FAD synthetase